MEKLGNNIRKIRVLRDLTQQQVSSELGMTQGNYARLEKGEIKISVDRLKAIAEILKCSTDAIEDFNTATFFSPEKHAFITDENNAPHKYYVSPELKRMYEERIDYLEGYIRSLKDEIDFLKSKS